MVTDQPGGGVTAIHVPVFRIRELTDTYCATRIGELPSCIPQERGVATGVLIAPHGIPVRVTSGGEQVQQNFSFNNVVGQCKQRRRHSDAKRTGGLEIDESSYFVGFAPAARRASRL